MTNERSLGPTSADTHAPDLRPARWTEAPARGLAFPYMFWAHTHAGRARYALTSSGMPSADAAFMESLGAPDLDPCTKSALPALEDALARRFGVGRERCLVTLGASGGLQLAAACWFRAGARVAADVPSYEPFRALPAFFGADVRPIERRHEDGWRVEPSVVRTALTLGSGPGHVFLANPHNPTGAMLDRAAMSALAAEAARAGGLLVSCDIYMEYVPEERAAWAFECAPNAVTIGSLTKAFGLGALRIGWIVLGEGVAHERVRLQDVAYLNYVDPPTATMRAGTAALARLPDLRAPLATVERESRPIWKRWLGSTPEIECVVPADGIIAFPRVRGIDDTFALAEHLVSAHQVGVVPGEFFGRAGHIRVGCALPKNDLIEALKRLEQGLRSFPR